MKENYLNNFIYFVFTNLTKFNCCVMATCVFFSIQVKNLFPLILLKCVLIIKQKNNYINKDNAMRLTSDLN